MKPKNKRKRNEPVCIHPQAIPIRFEFTHPTAVRVCVAGSFNEWHPTAKTMDAVGNGCWAAETDLTPGIYEYCLVVDGEWMPDPLAEGHVGNPFGGLNSLLRVGCSLDSAHLLNAEHHPLQSADIGQ
jgi:1,4-alpha-glucan branching enzyme